MLTTVRRLLQRLSDLDTTNPNIRVIDLATGQTYKIKQAQLEIDSHTIWFGIEAD